MFQLFQKRTRTEQTPEPTLSTQKVQQLAAMQSLQNETRIRQRDDTNDRDERRALSNAAIMGAVTKSFMDVLKPAPVDGHLTVPTEPVLSEAEKVAQKGRERTLNDKLKGVPTIEWITNSGWFEGFEDEFVAKLKQSMISTKMLISSFSQSTSGVTFAKQLGQLTVQEANAIYNYFGDLSQ
jgi:hypothetical protein